jgi:hypothetical protein
LNDMVQVERQLTTSVQCSLRVNVNIRVAANAEAATRRANNALQRAGFRAIRFGKFGTDPSPHVTVRRAWIGELRDLDVWRASWSRTVRNLVDAFPDAELPLRIDAARLHSSKGPYVLSQVTPLGLRTASLLQHLQGDADPLHMTIGASTARTTAQRPPQFSIPGRTHVRSVRLSIQGPYGTCVQTLEEIDISPRRAVPLASNPDRAPSAV